jgi:spore coat protein U-like protein
MRLTPRKRLLAGLAAALAAAAALPATAQVVTPATSTTTFSVTAQVSTTCFITASNLNFGAYAGVQLDGTTTLAATCSNTTPYNIGLNAGTATAATVSTRKMAGPGGQLLAYSLFQDSAHTTNWGNTAGTDTVASIGTGAVQDFTVFGRIPASQFVSAGSYSDTITVTLTF